MSRKIKTVYDEMNAPSEFTFEVFDGEHPWDNERRYALSEYFAKQFKLLRAERYDDDTSNCLDEEETVSKYWPKEAMTTDELARMLTGKGSGARLDLCDIFIPDCTDINIKSLRGDSKQIIAQYEAFL